MISNHEATDAAAVEPTALERDGHKEPLLRSRAPFAPMKYVAAFLALAIIGLIVAMHTMASQFFLRGPYDGETTKPDLSI